MPIAISSAYPVEVLEGCRSISRPNDSHQLKLPAGTTIRVRNRASTCSTPRCASTARIDYQVPALGFLTVLTTLRDLQREDRRQGARVPADHEAADRRRPVQGRDRRVPADRTRPGSSSRSPPNNTDHREDPMTRHASLRRDRSRRPSSRRSRSPSSLRGSRRARRNWRASQYQSGLDVPAEPALRRGAQGFPGRRRFVPEELGGRRCARADCAVSARRRAQPGCGAGRHRQAAEGLPRRRRGADGLRHRRPADDQQGSRRRRRRSRARQLRARAAAVPGIGSRRRRRLLRRRHAAGSSAGPRKRSIATGA